MQPESGQVLFFEGADYTITDVDTGRGLVEFRRPAGLMKGDTPYRRGLAVLSELRAVARGAGVALVQGEAARAMKQTTDDRAGEVFAAGQNAMTRFLAMGESDKVWVLPLRVIAPLA